MSVPSISHRIAQQLLMEKNNRSCGCTRSSPIFTKAFLQSSQTSQPYSQALPLGAGFPPPPQYAGENTALGHVPIKTRQPEKATIHPLLTLIQHIDC